jgi:hypothetical protein
MSKLDYLRLKCKEPGCPHEIVFTGEVKVPVNYKCAFANEIQNDSLFIEIGKVPQINEPIRQIGESIIAIVKIFQEQKTSQETELVYEINQIRKIHHKDKFYLTCESGHTHPYEILITI